MVEANERSGLFKFFYVMLSIITFPIYVVLFLLRHPLWVLFVLGVIAGGIAYWPLSQGVNLMDIPQWYQNKYFTVAQDVMAKATESGKIDMLPQSIVDEMNKIKEDQEEALRPKSENYNKKVNRDRGYDETKAKLKKRKGFKKQGDMTEEYLEVLSETAGASEGIAAFIKKPAEPEPEPAFLMEDIMGDLDGTSEQSDKADAKSEETSKQNSVLSMEDIMGDLDGTSEQSDKADAKSEETSKQDSVLSMEDIMGDLDDTSEQSDKAEVKAEEPLQQEKDKSAETSSPENTGDGELEDFDLF